MDIFPKHTGKTLSLEDWDDILGDASSSSPEYSSDEDCSDRDENWVVTPRHVRKAVGRNLRSKSVSSTKIEDSPKTSPTKSLVPRLSRQQSVSFKSAVSTGNAKQLKALLLLSTSKKKAANSECADGATLLHHACRTNPPIPDIVKILLDSGADPNAVDTGGWTPLLLACNHHHPSPTIIRSLISAEADPSATTFDTKLTALHLLAQVSSQPNLFPPKPGDSSPKTFSATEAPGESTLIELITSCVEKGADPDARCASGDSPLHKAALWGSNDVVAYLLGKLVDVDALNHLNQTPLHLAIIACQTKTVCQLLDAEASKPNLEACFALAEKHTPELKKVFRKRMTRGGFRTLAFRHSASLPELGFSSLSRRKYSSRQSRHRRQSALKTQYLRHPTLAAGSEDTDASKAKHNQPLDLAATDTFDTQVCEKRQSPTKRVQIRGRIHSADPPSLSLNFDFVEKARHGAKHKIIRTPHSQQSVREIKKTGFKIKESSSPDHEITKSV